MSEVPGKNGRRDTSRPSPLPPQPHAEISLSASSSPLKSPSSPNVSIQQPVRPSSSRGISRSKTLPRGLELGPARKRNLELDDLVLDSEKVRKLRRWILGFVLVDFDLDQGPVVHGCYPSLWLSPSESENIAFSSFPDSLQFEQGSQAHSFRIREQTTPAEDTTIPPDRPISADGFFYGYSYFTQRKDKASKRGYQQRSLVILTHHQYPALFSRLSSELGPLYEAHGAPMLETACQNISNWSDPVGGTVVELGFLGSVLEVELPLTPNEQQLTESVSFHGPFDPKIHVLASSAPFQPPPLLLFEASLSHLWSIWECLVLCEPILVFGASPAMTSQAVWWLRDLLRPIPLAGDIRPYLTIHDKDHSLLVNKLPPKAGLLLGVTNPFVYKSCSHWPHILSVGWSPGLQNPARMSAAGPPPGWKTKTHNRHISKDRDLLKQLEDACRGDARTQMSASLALRRHFSARTTALLVPLNRYLHTLLPQPSGVPDSTQPARLKPFNATHFLASLKAHGAPLEFRSAARRKEFYERWLRTPAFGMWLALQEEMVEKVLGEDTRRGS